MTATTETHPLYSIAEDLGITLTDVSDRFVNVHRNGRFIRRAARPGTTEQVLAEVLNGYLHPVSHPTEWATVTAFLNPDTTADEWTATAARLYR